MRHIHLQENEHILMILHRHWFVIARELAMVLFMIMLGVVLYFIRDVLQSLVLFLLSLYTLFILAFAFALWINYRLDVWIITNRRIIDIEQRGLFNREVSEFLISRVQDVTSEVPNMLATLLDFGNMTIQTAGHKNFYVHEIPQLEEAKRIILEYSQKARREEFVQN